MAAGLLRLAARSLSHPLSRRAPGPARGFASSSAALAEDDYWSDWEDEEEARRRARASAPIPGTDPAGDGPRGVQWVVMGRPGPQKHAHAARLAEVLDVPYISMGTLVRQELNPASQLYRKIANSVNEGRLVPEDIIFGLLTKRLEEGYHKGETGFILDGIPRTRMQAEILDEIVDVDLVLNFKCADDCFMKKRSRGDICSHCGQLFDVSNLASMKCSPCVESYTWHSQVEPASVVGLEDSRLERMRTYAKQIFYCGLVILISSFHHADQAAGRLLQAAEKNCGTEDISSPWGNMAGACSRTASPAPGCSPSTAQTHRVNTIHATSE